MTGPAAQMRYYGGNATSVSVARSINSERNPKHSAVDIYQGQVCLENDPWPEIERRYAPPPKRVTCFVE